MTEELKIGRLARDFLSTGTDFVQTRSAGANEPIRLSFPASSETPVVRYFGDEVLVHTDQAVRMDRINAGAAPLLFNHDWSDPIGMVDGGRIKDGRLWVDAHLFGTARAQEVAQMIDGGLRNVSVSYEIDEITEDKRGVYRATSWHPLEVSIVTVPADASVGLGRQPDNELKPVRMVRAVEGSQPAAPSASVGVANMADQQTAAGNTVAEPKIVVTEDHSNRPTPQQMEQQRKQAIRNLAKANNCDERYVDHWITTGSSLETVAEDMLKVQQERSETHARTFLDMPKKEVKRYSLMRALRATKNKDWSQAGLELEANKEISKRLSRLPKSDTSFFVPLDIMMRDRQPVGQVNTRDWDVAGTNGSNYLVSTNNQPGNFIELLRNTSVALTMGVRRLSGLQGNVTIPKMTAGTTAYWLADETTQITEANPTLGQVSLSPKNVAALTELSHLLLQQSSPDAEQLIMDSIARDIGLAVDVGVIRGSGNSGQPLGIVGTGSIGGFTGTSLAAAGLLDAQADVAAANAINGSCGYVTTPAVAALLMARPELPSTGTTRMWTGNIQRGGILGFPAMSSAQMATATMLFGAWDTVILAEWGVLELMVNPFSDFTRGLTAVRGWYTCDVALRYPGAFTYSSSIT